MPMRARGILLAAAVVAAATLVSHAQTPEARFDVVSIKVLAGPPQLIPGSVWEAGGRFHYAQTNVLNLLGSAYRPSGPGSLGNDHIDLSHVDGWVSAERFVIEARVADPPPGWGTDPVSQPYLRSMLADRFKLKAHFEKRELPIYWMVLAKSDGALGPNMKRTGDLECSDIQRLRRENPSAIPAPPPGGITACAVRLGGDNLLASFVSMDLFAGSLRGSVGAPVVNHTGLPGLYSVNVRFTTNAAAAQTTDAVGAGVISEWPTIFTAVQYQLGLRLERHSEVQDVLVVDHIEKPTED
jgi:uncharacterized protein (TIGR03435 family)